MDIVALVDSLGGVSRAAKRLGVSRGAVSMWKLRGAIPARCHLVVWQAALECGSGWRPPAADGFLLVRKAA